MVRYWIGTSGWQYRHWRGDFYPQRLPQRLWLAHYMDHFPTVELNNSFYRQPQDDTWDRWRQAASTDFRFAVKANRFLTHIKRLNDISESLERFLKGARRLQDRLGPVLFQTPPNFHRTPENQRRLAALLDLLPANGRFAVEFRHASWFGQETLGLLRAHDAAFCCYDMKDLNPPLTATAGFLYLRFHGPGDAYASNYTDTALKHWARRLRGLDRHLDEVWAYFNNDLGGHAVRNALTLTQLLEGEP
jgi:uncharacterized protein YecE (DUF72 family)